MLDIMQSDITNREIPLRRPHHYSLSIVVPMQNEAEVCAIFFQRLIPVLERLTQRYEVICVNDGSVAQTIDCLLAAHRTNRRIKIINLTRNFGKDVALTAGIDAAKGDAVIPIDADLQDPPELLPKLVDEWLAGNDMVLAVRSNRNSDPFLKRLAATTFYRTVGRFSERPLPENAGDFRLMDRRVVEALKLCPERTRFMKGLFAWVGYSTKTVTYVRAPRAEGVSKWPSWKLWNFGLSGMLSFTTLPLRIWTYLGLFLALVALADATRIVLRTLIFGVDLPGYPSLRVMILFFSGINMIGLGILGEYVSRVFIEVKQRPLYLIRERVGFDVDQKLSVPADA